MRRPPPQRGTAEPGDQRAIVPPCGLSPVGGSAAGQAAPGVAPGVPHGRALHAPLEAPPRVLLVDSWPAAQFLIFAAMMVERGLLIEENVCKGAARLLEQHRLCWRLMAKAPAAAEAHPIAIRRVAQLRAGSAVSSRSEKLEHEGLASGPRACPRFRFRSLPGLLLVTS